MSQLPKRAVEWVHKTNSRMSRKMTRAYTPSNPPTVNRTSNPKKSVSTMLSLLAALSARQRLPSLLSSSQIATRHVYIVVDPRKARQEKPKKKTRTGRASYRFVDKTRVRAVGGDGGKGNLSVFKIGRKHKLRPDGGHGGRGGNVIIVADPKEQSLNWSSPHVKAQSGSPGTSQERHGRDGKNLVLRVPCGVVVRRVLDYDEVWDSETRMVQKVEQEAFDDNGSNVEYVFEMDLDEDDTDDDSDVGTDEVCDSEEDDRLVMGGTQSNVEYRTADDGDETEQDFLVLPAESKTIATDDAVADNDELESDSIEFDATQERETVVLADLDKPGTHVVVARGGRGGVGNCTFAKRNGPLPDPAILLKRAKPQPGEVAFLELELKLIADLGLVGFPNAGKSSLLAAMSRAMPEIAPYPFTTLHPLVGCIEYRDGYRVMAADVPGLVRGASQGRGRGHDFLRHLERTKALLYLVDVAGVDGRGPVDDLLILAEELNSYGNGDMLTRPSLVVANKVDLLEPEECEAMLCDIGEAAESTGIRFDGNVLGISAGVTGVGLGPLSKAIRSVVVESEKERGFHDDYHIESYV